AAKRFGDPRGGEQFACLPACAGEVDSRRPARGRSILQIGQFFTATPGGLDARTGLAPLGRLLAAEPFGLAADLVGDRLQSASLPFEELVALLLELVVGAGGPEVPVGIGAAHLDDLVGDAAKKGPVVGDD